MPFFPAAKKERKIERTGKKKTINDYLLNLIELVTNNQTEQGIIAHVIEKRFGLEVIWLFLIQVRSQFRFSLVQSIFA